MNHIWIVNSQIQLFEYNFASLFYKIKNMKDNTYEENNQIRHTYAHIQTHGEIFITSKNYP